MPPSSGAGDPRAYASENKLWAESVRQARIAVRSQNISWVLSGTDGEQLAGADELRERFGGIIFVGDSQIREIAWAGFQMLITGRQDLRFYPKDAVFKPRNKMKAVHQLHSSCVPQSVGKTGFTAACPTLASGEPCNLHSPFPNKTYAEKMRKLLLTKPHNWDGMLSVSPHVCDSDFFVSYQATWGAVPVLPESLPHCLHGAREADGRVGEFRHMRGGVPKPILWVVDGCGLHEMEFCSERRFQLPNYVLARFPPKVLREAVVWQTVGAGFLMKDANRFKGACSSINADQVAAQELAYLRGHQVRHYNYTRVSLQYAPLMFDAIHFTYYWVPCAQTFPELARMVAQLAFQHGVGRPVEVCPLGHSTHNPLTAAERAGGLFLGQPKEQERAAIAAAALQAKTAPVRVKSKSELAIEKQARAENKATERSEKRKGAKKK